MVTIYQEARSWGGWRNAWWLQDNCCYTEQQCVSGHFLELYGKNKKSDVNKREIAAFEEVAKSLLGASPKQIEVLIEMGTISEKEVPDE